MDDNGRGDLPLAGMEDPEELKGRYRAISTDVLRRWMSAVIGPHHDAMAAVLAERERAASNQKG